MGLLSELSTVYKFNFYADVKAHFSFFKIEVLKLCLRTYRGHWD